MLLLVSLATLTRVETQVASNTQQLSKARQNALLALNIALGQLQKFTGPDQRVTAPADLVADQDKTGNLAPSASTAVTRLAVQPGARYWTGAWGNGEPAIGYDLNPNQIPGRGLTPVLLNWLVSGNEASAFSANGTKGGVTAGTAPAFTPAAALDFSANSTTAILLVGANSAGALANDQVAAPLVSITLPASMVAGTNSSSPTTVGRYAWWVGDEGVKARINLQNGYQKTNAAADRINSFVTAQRAAPEFMDRDPAGTASPVRVDTAYDFTSPRLPNIVSPRQLPLLNSALTDTAKNRFHDITATSMGILSDPYAGGLKKDLTADIADTSSSASASYRPADSDPVFTPRGTGEAHLPTWGHLRSWARATPNASGELTPLPATTTQAGISPIIVYAAVGIDAYLDPANTFRMAFFPAVYLANPYPVTMAATRYEIAIRFQPGACARLETAVPGQAKPVQWVTQATLDFGTLDSASALVAGNPATSTFAANNWIRFVIDSQAIPPGETPLYRLDPTQAGDTYAQGKLLTRAPADEGIATGVTNHLILPATFTLPATVADDHFFRIRRQNISVNDTSVWMETVLAKEGGLSATDGRFQTSTMITGYGARAPDTIHTSLGTDFGDQDPANISPLLIGASWRSSEFREAGAVIRFGLPMESFINWMSPLYGMPELNNHIWLKNGNFRSPTGISTRYETDVSLGYVGSSTFSKRSGTMVSGCMIANDTTALRDVVAFNPTRGYATSLGGISKATASSGAKAHIMDADPATPLNRAVFFDLLASPDRLLSLGQLQHVPFSQCAFSPLYPLGNAMPDVRIPRTATYTDGIVERDPGNSATTLDPAYDFSWHLNRALWDRYFVSGVPSSLPAATTPLPDARMTLYQPTGIAPALSSLKFTTGQPNDAYAKAAASLLVAGAFNINSTSEQAWRAVLGGPLGVTTNPDFAATGDKVDQIVPYARFARGFQAAATGPWAAVDTTMQIDINSETTLRRTNYLGNRGLWLNVQKKSTQTTTNTTAVAVINELARTIVQEIRRNGPFLSLSDFINRPILATKQTAGMKGALQTAIDTMSPLKAQANPVPSTGVIQITPALFQGRVGLYTKWDWEHFYGGPTKTVGGTLVYDGETGTDSFSYANAFGPKYLTQADVLSTLGPQLTARSDTFTIRTYGETVNPATQAVEGRAWCEAVVQRLPDYVDGAQLPEAAPAGLNATFGRRFKVVSFRWLGAQDL